jgi:hypothetical protein
MSEMKPGDSDRAAHGAVTTLGQAPIRASGIPALRPISRGEDWHTWPEAFWQGQRAGSAGRDV